MTETTAPLLAAILARPRDDLPRLVYADALEASGEPGDADRAEFIRVQVELAKYPNPGDCTHPTPFYDRLDRRDDDGPPLGYGIFTPRCRCPWCRLKRREYMTSRRYVGCGAWGQPFFVGSDDWRRGFVRQVRCELSSWVGGVCEWCHDRDPMNDQHYYVSRSEYDTGPTGPCPMCSGTGKSPAHGPALCRSHPVEMVMVSDKEPNTTMNWGVRGSGFVWGNLRISGSMPDQPDDLPSAVFDMLKGGTRRRDWWRIYPTRDDAMQALSAAALAWARSRPAA